MENKRCGFTLIEVILTLALIAIIIPTIYSILFTGQKSFNIGVEKVHEQQDYRILKDYLDKELKNVTYLKSEEPEEYEKYFSLEVVDNNGFKELEKIEYSKDNDSIKSKSIFNIKFKNLDLIYKDRNIVVVLNPVESNSKSINFSIFLENNPNVILSDEHSKMFYGYKIGSNDINEDIEERKWSKNIKYKFGDIVIYNKQKFRSIKKNGNNINNQPPKEQFWEKIE